jgi:hypothetical protein
MAQAISTKQIYDKLSVIEQKMITEEKLSEYLETFEILSNPETMESIKNSREDIRKGRIKKISSVKDMLNEL